MRSAKKPDYERPATVIGKDTVLESSKLASKSSVQVNGIFKGDAVVEASMVVGQGGQVHGNISAAFVLVAGSIEGNVEASEQLHVTKTAVINGDVSCASIVIDDGAVLNGTCKMTRTEALNNNPKNNKKK